MIGFSGIGNNVTTNCSKSIPFGASATPSFGNNAEYHDEFVRSDSGNTAKTVGIIGIVGLAVAAGVALLFRNPKAAEKAEKNIMEIEISNQGILSRAYGGVKSWWGGRKTNLANVTERYAQQEISKVPRGIWRLGRWLNPFNHFGKGAARTEGRILAEESLRVRLAPAEAAAKAAKAEKATEEAAKKAEKKAAEKAERDAKKKAERDAKAKTDEPESSLGSAGKIKNREDVTIPSETSSRSTVVSTLEAKLEAKKAEIAANHGRIGRFFRRIFGSDGIEIDRLERQIKIAKKSGRGAATVPAERVSVDSTPITPPAATTQPATSTPAAATAKAVTLSAAELLDKQGTELLSKIASPEITSLEEINRRIDTRLKYCQNPSKDDLARDTAYNFRTIKYNHPARDAFVDYAQKRAELIGHKLTNIHEAPSGAIGFDFEKI